MAVPQHLEEAVGRLKEATERIDHARQQPSTLETQREWLSALTDFVHALSDVHEYNNESIHEKLHDLAARAGMRRFPA